MKYGYKLLSIFIYAFALCLLPGLQYVSAQEDFEYDFLIVEEESPAVSSEITPQEELQNMQKQLSELEYYLSDLKAKEVRALAAIPAGIKNKKFNSVAEKAGYYKKVSNEYTERLSNDELSNSDIRISQNLIILADLYATQQSIALLKKEIAAKKQNLKTAP